MHIEPAYPQNFMPRLTQHPVTRRTIQSVVHPATDQSTDYTADGAAHRSGGGDDLSADLRRPVTAAIGDYFAAGSAPRRGTRASAASSAGSGWRRRFVGIVSVWHLSNS